MAKNEIVIVGEGEDAIAYELPPQPSKKEIDGYDLPKKQQKFKRQEFLSVDDFEKLPVKEQVELISREFIRRVNGYWFYNNGIPTYITGSHYFYLNFWFMAAAENDGYPDYRESNKKFFYFMDLCEKDPNCFGYIAMTAKRMGKTEQALAEQYNIATLVEKNKLFGIQALTHPEARGLFKDRIMRSHGRIPQYLRPLSNADLSTKPIVGELTFKGDRKKGSNDADALNNVIDHRATVVSAYQGKKPRKIFLDELGTVEGMDVIEWWSTVREQLALGAKRIVGKAALPATLENITNKGAIAFKELWDTSNHNKRDKNGRTESGLYRYFQPFYKGYEGCVDEYGFDMEDEAKEFRQNKLENATPGGQAKIKRQYPASVEEAFDVIRGDVWEMEAKEAVVLARPEAVRRTREIVGYKIWVDKDNEVQKRVVEEKYINEKREKTGTPVLWVLEPPQKDAIYRIGVDGTGTDKETGGQAGSNFAFVVLKGFAGMNAKSYTPVAHFSWRPEKIDTALSMLFATAVWYDMGNRGLLCKVMGETNQGGGSFALDYFGRRGRRDLLMKKPKSLATKDSSAIYWVWRTGDIKNWQFILANRFLPMYGNNIEMLELLEQIIGYTHEGNFDLVDAWLMALMSLGNDWEKSAEDLERENQKPVKMKRKMVRENGRLVAKWVESNPKSIRERGLIL